MDLYIFCVVLGAAGMAAMAFLGFASSHSAGHHAAGHHAAGHHAAGHHGHETSGHEMHGVGGAHTHSVVRSHGVAQGHAHLWSWLSPRVLFNFLVGFGATGLILEKLVGPMLALPIAFVGGFAFETFIVRPIFNSLFRFESRPAQTLESALMSEGRAVTGFDANGNGLISLELGGEVVQVLGTQLKEDRAAGVRIRAGDTVRIEDVDGARNRCTVSRIGLGETESRDADRY
jgi:hypothetical protein